MIVGSTIASMIATESIRMVFSAAPIGPCGSRMFIAEPYHGTGANAAAAGTFPGRWKRGHGHCSTGEFRIRSPCMDIQETASGVLGNAIVEWLADEALLDSDPAVLCGELCQRLRGVGMPIKRGQIAFRVLHPLYDASTVSWSAK